MHWLAHQPLVILASAALGAIAERVSRRLWPDLFPKGVRWGFMHWMLVAIVADAVLIGIHFTVPHR